MIRRFLPLVLFVCLLVHADETQERRDRAAAERLLPLLDLERAEMAPVKALAEQGNPGEALRIWRDLLLARMRRLDYQEYYQHDYAQHWRQVGIADFLAGEVSREEYLKDASRIGFLDIFGMAGPPSRERRVDWFAQPEAVTDWGNPEIAAWSLAKKRSLFGYDAMHFGRSFVARYWETDNPAYRRKIMDLMDDYVVNHFRLFWDAYARGEVHTRNRETQQLYYTDWRHNVNALDTAGRARNFVIFQAGLAKCLGEGRPADWPSVLRPVAVPLTREQAELIPADQMANIAVSLMQHHASKVIWFVDGPSLPNQRLHGLKSLLTLAITYPNFRHTPTVVAAFEKNMDILLADNYLPDGGNLEQSFNYNHGELRDLAGILDVFGENPPPFAQRIRERIAARRAMDDGLRTPLGGLPQVGNNSDFVATGKNTWSTPEASEAYRAYRKAQNQPSAPEPQPYLSQGYSYSGYYAMRGGWEWDSPYLFFMAGRPQSGHFMHDGNSIQVIAHGRHLLVCDGPPTYGFRHTPEAEYAAEAVDEHCGWKANTVMVDGKCQARQGGILSRAPQVPVPLRWHTSERFDLIDHLCDRGYQQMRPPHGDPDRGVAHRRQVVFLREAGCWIVEDRMLRRDETARTYTQTWNFLPKVESEQDYARRHIDGFAPDQFDLQPEQRRFATTDPDGPNLEFVHLLPGSIRYRLYHGDREELKGWFAPGLGSLCAAPDVHAEWDSADSDRLVTLLLPRPKNGTPPLDGIVRREGPGWFGFDGEVPGGGTLAYRTAQTPVRLEVGPVVAVASGLLVRERDGVLSGLVSDAEELTIAGQSVTLADATVEFVHRDGKTAVVAIPLQRSPLIAEPPPFLPGAPVPTLEIAGEEGLAVRYTLDGSEPTAESPLYSGPVTLARPATVKARYGRGNEVLPFVAVRDYLPTDRAARPADYPLDTPLANGLQVAEIRHGPARLYDLMLQPPARTFTRATWQLGDYAKETDFGLRQTCLIRIPERGFWQFHLKRGKSATAGLVVAHPEQDLVTRPLASVGWWAEAESGSIPLEAGFHHLEIQYGCFYNPQNGLEIEIEGPGTPRQPLPDSWLHLLP